MASITVKNIPDDLYAGLKRMASVHHRSINNEIIACLETRYGPCPRRAAEILSQARTIRRLTADCAMTPEQMEQAIEQGRT